VRRWVEVARECWSPAFVEDRFVECFDVAVGLWAACVDARVLDLQLLKEAAEGGSAELVAVV
jgi:hypothetical protein